MLSIRMQRLGRKGHPTYRMVVQDSRQSPTSGKFVAMLGSYDPHTKTSSLQKDRVSFYLEHGAQPTDRVVRLLSEEKISLPKWVKQPTKQKRAIKNPEKLRRNRPEEPTEVKEAEEASSEEKSEEASAAPAVENPSSKEVASAEEKPDADAKAEPEEEKTAQVPNEQGDDQNTAEADDSGEAGGKKDKDKDAKTA